MRFLQFVACAYLTAACEFPRPPPIMEPGDSGVVDASPGDDARPSDGEVSSPDANSNVDASSNVDARSPVCTANQALRCEGGSLVRCNSDGSAEVTESCALGCNVAQLRCQDVNPSNSLATFLDMTAGEPAFDLGTSATINTDTGTVIVDGASIVVKSASLAQTAAPTIRVFIVRSLTAGDVKITGTNAFAVVSDGDLHLGAVFASSAAVGLAGAGGFNSGACKGGDQAVVTRGLGGAGGAGFGLAGGKGGTAANDNGTATGGVAGTATGNATLIPLRGGCDSGKVGGLFGAGGGAIQLVSRTRIVVSGVVAANGSSATGGGSGGGILLEAPVVEVSGAVVANGGGGAGGCFAPAAGENGRLDAMPASAGIGCASGGGVDGGTGGAGTTGATNGASVSMPGDTGVFAGHGGGGVGRIRVNTAPGGLHTTGLFSPNPSTGALATR